MMKARVHSPEDVLIEREEQEHCLRLFLESLKDLMPQEREIVKLRYGLEENT